MYITEIEKANNYLKLQVCQGFEQLHISDKIKHEFVEKIHNLENKPYFHRKLAALDCNVGQVLEPHVPRATQPEPEPPAQKQSSEESQNDAKNDRKAVKEVRFASETEKLINSYSFFDGISTSCKEDEQSEPHQRVQQPKRPRPFRPKMMMHPQDQYFYIGHRGGPRYPMHNAMPYQMPPPGMMFVPYPPHQQFYGRPRIY